MTKEKIVFNTNEDIIMQIEIDSYMKYNDTIASMNDHLGEIYGYSDVENVENAQTQYEKQLAYKAIAQLQQENKELKDKFLKQTGETFIRQERIDKAIEYLEQPPVILVNGEYRNIYAEDDNKLLEILKGGSNE